jgi:nucleoid-associated protein YgaU
MQGFARAEDIRSHFHLSDEDFTRLNPALRKSVLRGNKFIPKNYYVRIPATARTRDLASRIPSRLYHPRQVRDEEYFVRRGDTVGAIARKYKISAAELVTANNLNRKAMIRIGQKLKIPAGAGAKTNAHIVILEPRSKNKPD